MTCHEVISVEDHGLSLLWALFVAKDINGTVMMFYTCLSFRDKDYYQHKKEREQVYLMC